MATSVIVFMAGAHLAAGALIDALRTKQIHELNEVALRRSEAAADFGVVTLNELFEARFIGLQRVYAPGRAAHRLPA